MDDVALTARISDAITLHVSPLDGHTFREYVDADNLGGSDGYFVARTMCVNGISRFEVLAKSPTVDAALAIFDMIVDGYRRGAAA